MDEDRDDSCRPPRAYNLGRRQARMDATRERIVEAARALVLSENSAAALTMEAVASHAGVTRATVYHRFPSKRAILEAVFDDIARRGGMERMADAFREPDPLRALEIFFAVFATFWNDERLILRRLRALAMLDRELELSLRSREERRREGARVMVRRLHERYGRPSEPALDESADIVFLLCGFEAFDTLAGETRTREDAAMILFRMCAAALGLDPGTGVGHRS